MQVHTIHSVDTERNFNEDEAYGLVDLLLIVTSKSKNKINALNTKIDIFENYPDKAEAANTELNNEIHKWSDKVRRIGGTPLALYKVKINHESGFYTWEYPSANLEFTTFQ